MVWKIAVLNKIIGRLRESESTMRLDENVLGTYAKKCCHHRDSNPAHPEQTGALARTAIRTMKRWSNNTIKIQYLVYTQAFFSLSSWIIAFFCCEAWVSSRKKSISRFVNNSSHLISIGKSNIKKKLNKWVKAPYLCHPWLRWSVYHKHHKLSRFFHRPTHTVSSFWFTNSFPTPLYVKLFPPPSQFRPVQRQLGLKGGVENRPHPPSPFFATSPAGSSCPTTVFTGRPTKSRWKCRAIGRSLPPPPSHHPPFPSGCDRRRRLATDSRACNPVSLWVWSGTDVEIGNGKLFSLNCGGNSKGKLSGIQPWIKWSVNVW